MDPKGLKTGSSKDTRGISPNSMREHAKPWLSSQEPDLASTSGESATPSAEVLEELLRPRHMSESYTAFDLPLKSDPALLERYINNTGGMRMGKLFERKS